MDYILVQQDVDSVCDWVNQILLHATQHIEILSPTVLKETYPNPSSFTPVYQ